MAVFIHVEVGSFPKDPDLDLFARVGRRGPPRKGSPLYVAEKVTNPYGFVIGKRPTSRAPQNLRITENPEYPHLFLEKRGKNPKT